MHTEIPAELADVLAAPQLPQRAFPWIRNSWLNQMHDLPETLEMLHHLPERVDRDLVRQIVLAEITRGEVLAAFVAAMVWGYGDARYGAVRVRWVLTGIQERAFYAPVRGDLAGLLATAADVVRVEGPVEGFRYMNNAGRIKFLASAFFTKWLYFASALTDADAPEAAPILDKRVSDWLCKRADFTLDISRTPDYQRYLDTLTAWGLGYGSTPVQVERAIFGLATGRN